jgi:hypothetical protein
VAGDYRAVARRLLIAADVHEAAMRDVGLLGWIVIVVCVSIILLALLLTLGG